MVNPLSRNRLFPQSLFVLAALLVLCLAGNYFALRLITGFDYLFGSITVMLVLGLFGTAWGFLAALLASFWTIALFGHPYAMIWLCGEALFVGLLIRRGAVKSIVLYDALYWPLLGVPLVWLLHRHVLHTPPVDTLAVLLMHWINGMTNAVMASLLLTFFSRSGEESYPLRISASIPIQTLMFNLLMAFAALPALVVMILSTKSLIMRDQINSMLALLFFDLLALGVSVVASRRLTAPLRSLSKATIDLPERLMREKISSWPASRITEIDQLIANFRNMSSALNNRFQEITYINETLELRVEERTRQLSEINSCLQKEIAERHATEGQLDHLMEELVHQVRFLQTLINAIPNPIFYKDINGRYQGCNRAFEEKWGFSREVIVGKTGYDLFPRQNADFFDKADQQLYAEGGVQVYETQLRYADNLLHSVIFYKAAYQDASGKTVGMVGTIIDISDRKNAETERDRLMIELRQKNKELEGIVYVASHDLRSPLVNVQGFSRRLAKSCAEIDSIISGLDIPAEEREKLRSILSSTIPKAIGYITGSIEKMDGLLNGLLRLSRLGRAAICFEQLDMRRIVASVVAAQAFQIESAGATVEVDDLAPCLADAVQMAQVFSNLIDNAIKYRSGERVLFVRVSSEEFPEGVRYCVEDNGIGIPADQQEKIWEIFSRLDPNGTPGEGLGLTMTRRIIDRLGGSIWVESEADSGSRFYIVMPKQPKLDV